MNERLKGKKILITGASSGIGQFLAIHAAAEGAVPILTARSEDKLKLMSETIESTFGHLLPLV